MVPASWPSSSPVLVAQSLTPRNDPSIISLPDIWPGPHFHCPGRRPLITEEAMLDHLTYAEAAIAKIKINY